MNPRRAAGWMTRDVGLLRRVGTALLRFQRQPFTLRRWLVAADAFELADPAAATALYEVGSLRAQHNFLANQTELGARCRLRRKCQRLPSCCRNERADSGHHILFAYSEKGGLR